MSSPPRTVTVNRHTKETAVQLSLSLDGGSLDLLPSNPHLDNHPTSADPSSAPIPDQAADTHASQITASQHIWIWTGVGFLDHMLHALAKHAGWSLRLRCRGDLRSGYFCLVSVQLLSTLVG